MYYAILLCIYKPIKELTKEPMPLEDGRDGEGQLVGEGILEVFTAAATVEKE